MPATTYKFVGRSRGNGQDSPRERQVESSDGEVIWAEEGSILWDQAVADPRTPDDVLADVDAYVREFWTGETPETPAFNDWRARISGHLAYSLFAHGYRSGLGQHATVEALAEMVGMILAPLSLPGLLVTERQTPEAWDEQIAAEVKFAEDDLTAEYPHKF
jgi:hypothetical protein